MAVEAEICNKEWKSCKTNRNKEHDLREKLSAIIDQSRGETLSSDVLGVIVEHVGTCQWNLEECVRKTKEMEVGEVNERDVEWGTQDKDDDVFRPLKKQKLNNLPQMQGPSWYQ